eukprot:364410-Chlamydomonas_euryale.AAC.6
MHWSSAGCLQLLRSAVLGHVAPCCAQPCWAMRSHAAPRCAGCAMSRHAERTPPQWPRWLTQQGRQELRGGELAAAWMFATARVQRNPMQIVLPDCVGLAARDTNAYIADLTCTATEEGAHGMPSCRLPGTIQSLSYYFLFLFLTQYPLEFSSAAGDLYRGPVWLAKAEGLVQTCSRSTRKRTQASMRILTQCQEAHTGKHAHTHTVPGSAHTVTGSAYTVTGSAHTVTGSAHTVTGSTHTVTGSAHTVTGSAYTVTGSAHTVTGSAHMVTGSAYTVTGSAHKVTGSAHTVTGSAHTVTGSAHMVKGSADGYRGNEAALHRITGSRKAPPKA